MLAFLCAAVAAASSTAPPTEAELLAASSQLQNGKLTVESMELFERAVEHSPSDFRAHAMLGQALAKNNDGEAISALTRAHELAPKVGPVMTLLAAEHRKLGHRKKALDLYRKAVRVTPADADAYTQLGLLASDVGDSQEALAAWKTAIGVAPGHYEAHRALAAGLAAREDVAQRAVAIKHAKKALKLEPALAVSYSTMADALLMGEKNFTNLTKSTRGKLQQALAAQIRLQEARQEPIRLASAADNASLALAHMRSFHLLTSDEAFGASAETGDATLGAMAVQHLRQAAALRPDLYAERARQVRGWEEAERLSKRADHHDRLQREAMVGAMHKEFESKRLQEEEDRAIAEEEARERAPPAEARARRGRAPAALKSELR